MRAGRGIIVHVILLGIASGVALRMFTKEDSVASAASKVQVWGGRPSEIKSVSLEAPDRRVVLEARSDSQGPWFVGTVDKAPDPTPQDPHAAMAGDAGAPMSSAQPKPAGKRETVQLVSVAEGKKMTEALAPFMALRALGKIQPSQASEFELDKPKTTLRVTFSDGKPRTLQIGGDTPSGSDKYARYVETGDVYAISGDWLRNITYAEQRLLERDLHDFEEGEVTRVKITTAKGSRELVRMPDRKTGWADAKTPTALDETAGNWMDKVDRLKAQQYLEQVGVPVLPEYQVVKIEYFDGSKPVGFLELTEIPESKGNAGFIAKTEHTRWYAQVLKSSAEQVKQDLASVLK